MRASWMFTVGLSVLLGGAASAGPAGRDCSRAAMRKARAAAAGAVQAKDYRKAIGMLEPILRDCKVVADPVECAWLASDLAAARDKNGQFLECARLMAPLTHPLAGTGNDRLVGAIAHNFEHCSAAFDAQYAAIKPGGCTLTIDHALATAAVPGAMVPGGATTACIALMPGARAGDGTEEGAPTCPKVALIWRGPKPGLERQDLTVAVDNHVLVDESSCCNLSSIAAGTMAGKAVVRVRGQGRDCSGGTGYTASDVFYHWKGSALTPMLDASIGLH